MIATHFVMEVETACF